MLSHRFSESDMSQFAINDDQLAGCLEIDLGQLCEFNVVELQEYIPLGQRVKLWAVDAWNGSDWLDIGKATTVGYKRLLRFPETTASRVRIRITEASACPTINHVGLYKAPTLKVEPESSRQIPGNIPKDGCPSEP
jgi:alpha-L-fucosidase